MQGPITAPARKPKRLKHSLTTKQKRPCSLSARAFFIRPILRGPHGIYGLLTFCADFPILLSDAIFNGADSQWKPTIQQSDF
jgi:hypothetical protein